MKTVMLTHAGRSMPLASWAKEIGVSYACLQSRLRYRSLEKALAMGKQREKRKPAQIAANVVNNWLRLPAPMMNGRCLESGKDCEPT